MIAFARPYWLRQSARWLVLLVFALTAAHAAPVITSLTPGGSGTGFVRVAPEASGVDFANHVTLETVGRHVTLIASGLAAGDVDGDGLCDLYFCRIDGPNVLYRNLGNWQFDAVADGGGAACTGRHSIGAAFADVDGDGDLDLLTTARQGPTSLFINDGKGQFSEDETFALAGKTKAGTTAAFADADGDGDLDLYVANYRSLGFGADHLRGRPDAWLDENAKRLSAGKPVDSRFAAQFFKYQGELQEKGEPDDFLLNDGKGNFTPVPAGTIGAAPLSPGSTEGWGLCAQWRDFDGDGDPDLYVCNDFHTPDRFWLNNGRGQLRHQPVHVQRRQSFYSMAVDAADLDADGHLDFFVADMLSRKHSRRKRQMGAMGGMAPQADPYSTTPQIMQNTLFRNRGDGTYAEIAQYAGLKASEWTWGVAFMDVDLDGRPDLVTSTGMVYDWMDADTIDAHASGGTSMDDVRKRRSRFPRLKTRNLIFRNLGDWTFEERGQAFGLDAKEVSGGLVVADLDGDGDGDLVFNSIGAPAEIYRNESTAPRIAVRLKGTGANTRAVGAVTELHSKTQVQRLEVLAGGRYASHFDDLLTFAAPADEGPFRLQVRWRDGRMSECVDVAVNSLVTLHQADAVTPDTVPHRKTPDPIFVEDRGRILHMHAESSFDDFARQPLLPNRMSRFGPGVAWCDLDGDGDDDLLFGGSRGASTVMLGNYGDRFAPLVNTARVSLPADVSGLLALPHSGGGLRIYLGLSGWEAESAVPALRVIERQAAGEWQGVADINADEIAAGPLAAGDIDGDGRLDVLVTGRMMPGRYPAPATSFLVLDDDGKTENPQRWSDALRKIGLVSGAVCADFHGDSRADLLLVREWGAPLLLRNSGQGFEDVSEARGLAGYDGWWNGVAVGDFNGDGRLDFIATNWGENSKYGRSPGSKKPLLVRYGDIDESGSFDVIEAHTDSLSGKLVPERGFSCSSGSIPYIRERTLTYAAFGDADLLGVYGDRLDETDTARASELRHGVFLNRGERFEFLPLPQVAQWAPAFGVSVADFDGDGNLDAFLAQNFFAVQPETPRNDGGRGLLLLGGGDGRFRAADAALSGIAIYGDQRACAASDFDADGRVDLVVTQNADLTRLFRNSGARPGLRVRLIGGSGNPAGIGAVLRPICAEGPGAAQVVTAGSGHQSQDSLVKVLTAKTPITAVEVRWPGGRKTVHAVKKGDTEIRIVRKQGA